MPSTTGDGIQRGLESGIVKGIVYQGEWIDMCRLAEHVGSWFRGAVY